MYCILLGFAVKSRSAIRKLQNLTPNTLFIPKWVETPAEGQEVTVSLIQRVVADYYGLTKQQLISKSRTSNIANARQIAMYLCRYLIDLPFVKIGDEFGKRDHSTVMSACKKVEAKVKKDAFYKQAINELEKQIKAK